MAESKAPPSRNDYTVAWICALSLELAAGKDMFDEIHAPLQQPPTDTNSYTLGSICGHNVVMAGLPAGVMGTTPAATVVAHLRSTFPKVQFGLLVGIGGGVPTEENDIRLGDIVVSKPTATYGGVVQYDYGKATADGQFEQMGLLNKPPEVLLTSISRLEANYRREETPIVSILKARCDNVRGTSSYPGEGNDQLFDPTYQHENPRYTCERCDPHRVIRRKGRTLHEPEVHYGLIASGNQVMKDGRTRDKLARKYGILCFEMEAAGLMNHLPCLVVRGISDYCDSHKNDRWQKYAAMTAAAYTRLLLSIVPLSSPMRSSYERNEWTEAEKRCLKRLFSTDPETDMNALKGRRGGRAPDTCEWMMETDELLAWIGPHQGRTRTASNVLWLHGNPGTGKSTMAITLVEALSAKPAFRKGEHILVYFFCDSSSEDHRTALGIMRGLLYQLVHRSRRLMRPLKLKYDIQSDKLFNSFDALWDLFVDMGRENRSEIYCVIDALDECDYPAQEALLSRINGTFPSTQVVRGIHLFLTSRPYEEIKRQLGEFPNYDLGAYDKVQDDLQIVIREKVRELARKKKYPKHLEEQVTMALREKSEGTFLWVGIACNELINVRLRDTLKTLQALPPSLDSLYRKLLDTAIGQNKEDENTIIRLLSFVAIARRPLTVLEISEACQLYLDMDVEDRLAYVHEDISMCRLLIVLQGSVVSLLHRSLRDFLTGSERYQIVDERAAHARFAYSCIDRLVEAFQKGELDRAMADASPFLQYSAENWPVHAHLGKFLFTIQDRHSAFFQFNSEIREKWLEFIRFPASDSKYATIPYNMSVYHIAARWGIPCLISYAQTALGDNGRQPKAPRPMIKNANSHLSGGRTPLEESAIYGHTDVFQMLLDQTYGEIIKEPAVIQAVVGNNKSGREMLETLLDRRPCRTQITPEVVVQAARNENGGIIELLYQKLGDSLPITEKVIQELAKHKRNNHVWCKSILDRFDGAFRDDAPVKAIAMHGNSNLMAMLLDHIRSSLCITSDIVLAATLNIDHGLGIVKLLLRRFGPRLPLTENDDIFSNWRERVQRWSRKKELVAEFQELLHILLDQLDGGVPTLDTLLPTLTRSHSIHGGEVLLVLVQRRPNKVVINQDFVEAAANSGHTELMKLLCDREEIINLDIERVLQIIARRGTEDLMHSLLRRLGDDHAITAKVVESAALNPSRDGVGIVKLLCSRLGDHLPLTPSALCSVAASKLGLITFDLLIEHFNDSLPLSVDVFRTATSNNAVGPEIITRLAQRYPNKVPCSSQVVETAARSKDGGITAMTAMFRQVERGILGMEDLLINVAAAGHKEVMNWVLEHFEIDLAAVSEDILVAGAQSQNTDMMTLLLQHHAGTTNPSPNILLSAAGNFQGSSEMLKLLLNHPLFERQISPEMLHTILYTSLNGDAIPMILSVCGRGLDVTIGIFKAAVSHASHTSLALFLNYCVSHNDLPEEVLEHVVRGNSGHRKLSLLLDTFGHKLKLTEVILETAASNYYWGRGNITLLLDRMEVDDVPITEEAVISLLRNSNGNFDLGLLLLERFGSKLGMTPRFARAIASYGDAQLVAMVIGDHDIPIDKDLIQAAAENECHGHDILAFLIGQSQGMVVLTEEILAAAAANYNPEALIFLLDHCRDSSLITSNVLASAARASRQAVARLIREQPDTSLVRESVALAAMHNPYHGGQIIKLLYDHVGDRLPITENVLKASVFSSRVAASTTRFLLQCSQDRTLVTEDVVKAAVRNHMAGSRVLQMLFDVYEDDLPVTTEVLETAASNYEDGNMMVRLILEKWPGIPITEELVVKAVAGDREPVMMKLLLDERPGEVLITEKVLLATVGNQAHGYELLRLLIKHKKNAVRECLTERFLCTTTASGEPRILRLLELSFSIKVKKEWLQYGQLYTAARESNGPVVDELIQQGIHLDTRNARGETPLWRAASENHQSIVQSLLETKAVDVNAASDTGDTPLICAARFGYTNTVRMLLNHGADPSLVNNNGNSAYAMAKMRFFFGTMRLLEQHGGQQIVSHTYDHTRSMRENKKEVFQSKS